MTIVISEKQVESLIEMSEVVQAVEDALRSQGDAQVENMMRTRTRGSSSVLNVMHANLSYLGRGGLKAYMSSKGGTKFVFILFDSTDSTPLAVMGADVMGRYRTGAASGVATKHLYPESSGTLALFGSGKQALTQAMAVAEVISLEGVRVWSPTKAHREAFAAKLSSIGIAASAHDSAADAIREAQVVTTITSSIEPVLTEDLARTVSHANVCGGNIPGHSEISPRAVGLFDTVVVDDLPQARLEYGDLIGAEKAGTFDWDTAIALCKIVAGKEKGGGKTLFKSGGAALEDVAVASLLYDKAVKSGADYPSFSLA